MKSKEEGAGLARYNTQRQKCLLFALTSLQSTIMFLVYCGQENNRNKQMGCKMKAKFHDTDTWPHVKKCGRPVLEREVVDVARLSMGFVPFQTGGPTIDTG